MIDLRPRKASGVNNWFTNVYRAVWTTRVGMSVTIKYMFSKSVTVQYPDERSPVPDRYRGIHVLEQEKCIYCFMCARACPIDCIEMEAGRDEDKQLDWVKFTVDYNKCMFCELCIYPCPEDCIHMSKEFALVTEDRTELDLDLLSWKGKTPESEKTAPADEAVAETPEA